MNKKFEFMTSPWQAGNMAWTYPKTGSVMESFVSPGTLNEFFGDCWPRKHFSVHGDMQRFPEVVKSIVKADFLDLAQRYKGPLAVANGEKSPVMTAAQGNAADFFKMGLTVYLTNIEPYFPGTADMLRSLENELGVKPKSGAIGLFAAPKGGGLQVHYDTMDIFSIQIRGTKKFNVAPVKEIPFPYGKQYSNERMVFDDLYPQAGRGLPDWNTADFETVVMKPGTFLYMPRGTWHFTETCDEESLSIGFGFNAPSAVDTVLDVLRATLIQDEAWRKPLYGIWGGRSYDDAVAQAEQLLQKLPEIARKINIFDLQLAVETQAEKIMALLDETSRFHTVPTYLLESEKAPAHNNVPMETVYIKSTHSRKSDRLVMRVDAMPVVFSDMLRWILEQKLPFSLGDFYSRFAGSDTGKKNEVFVIAVRSGMVKTLWFPLLK